MSGRNFVYVEGKLNRVFVRDTKAGKVANFSLTVSVGKKSSFVNVVLWNPDETTEAALLENESSGQVTVKGHLNQDQWKDKNGNDRRDLKVVAESVSVSPAFVESTSGTSDDDNLPF